MTTTEQGGTLNARQRKFVELYAATGNASQSAIGAGYSRHSAATNAAKLLKNTQVQQYLLSLAQAAEDSRIATVDELRQFWTSVMRDRDDEKRDRLKASELLGKSLGVFIEKRELSGTIETGVKYIAGLSEDDL